MLSRLSPTIKGKKYWLAEPKLSPEKRKQRRLAYRNENTLHKRTSSLSGDSMISVFAQESQFQIYTQEEWWSDKWDATDYGTDFDFSKNFFDQFYALTLKVPRVPLINNKAENSPYCNFADGNKDCHMISSANWNQDSYYSFLLVNCKDAVDCTWCMDSEIMYECTDCRDCYDLRFSQHCNNCSQSAFIYDCIGTKNALFCTGLRSAQYQIFNKQVTKEEFEKAYNYYFSEDESQLKEAKKLFADFLKNDKNLRTKFIISSQNATGNNIWNSKNIQEGYDIFDSEDCQFLHDGLKAKDCADICFFDGTELCYESTSLIGYGYRFTNFCRDSHTLFYCDSCHSCKDCFGCVGLRNKQFCIFNKQYTQDQYEDLTIRIITKMTETGEWGEFFPMEYSPFPYAETLAQKYFPREGATCTDNPGGPFKIIDQERNFYKKLRLPLPTKSPQQRLKERLERRS